MITYVSTHPVHQFIQRRPEIRKDYELPAEQIIAPEHLKNLQILEDQVITTLVSKGILVRTRIDFRYGFLEHTPAESEKENAEQDFEKYIKPKIATIIKSQPLPIQAVFEFKAWIFEQAAESLALFLIVSQATGLSEEEIHKEADKKLPLLIAAKNN